MPTLLLKYSKKKFSVRNLKKRNRSKRNVLKKQKKIENKTKKNKGRLTLFFIFNKKNIQTSGEDPTTITEDK